MFEVFGDAYSGNCYKIKLLLNLLELEHRWNHIDILQGESRTDEFLRKNPNGRIPVLITLDKKTLCESNAILHYLAVGTPFVPDDDYEFAQVLQWQFFEQYSHEPYIATSRYIVRYLNSPADRMAELESKRTGGYAALNVMEQHLSDRKFFVGSSYSIADIALYAYTHVAQEGGLELGKYPIIRRWIDAVSNHPRHIAMAN